MSEKITVHYPEYYRNFNCIGSACEDTCCASWNITADSESVKRYRRETGEFGKRLREGIHLRTGRIQMKQGICPFLNEDRLCEMYIHMGKESLCKTCREFPRHVEDYGYLREISLSLACPEAARWILMGEDTDLRMKTRRVRAVDPIEEEEALDFLLKLRDVCFYLLDYGTRLRQEEKPSMRLKTAMLLALARDVQKHLDRGETAPLALLGRYTKKGSFERFEKHLMNMRGLIFENPHEMQPQGEEAELRSLAIQYLEAVQTLFPVSEKWRHLTAECCAWLKQAEAVKISSSHAFLEEAMLRNLMHYYLYIWLLGAVYDGEPLIQVKMAVVSCILIELVGRYLWTGEGSKQELLVFVAHLWARELEHSNENLTRMETLLREDARFGFDRMLKWAYVFKDTGRKRSADRSEE